MDDCKGALKYLGLLEIASSKRFASQLVDFQLAKENV